MIEILKSQNLPSVAVGDGFESHHEGDERPGVIQGTIVKFTNEATWVTRDADELPADRELIATDIIRVVQKWLDGMPVETRILAPGENFPDLEALNEAAPKSERAEGPTARSAVRGSASTSCTCSIRKLWIDIRTRPAPSAAAFACVICATKSFG
jgi:hypothetical protein